MKFKAKLKEMNEGIQQAYENWAKRTGYEVTENTLFDCRCIEVSKEVDDYFWKWYTDKAMEENPRIEEDEVKTSLAMMFVCYGAKRNEELEPWTVDIQEGFAKEK